MKFTNETKLGIIVTLCFIVIILTITFLGKLKFSDEGYTLRVRFTFIGDLKVGAPVIFAGGIRVGKVANIIPYQDQVEVLIKLNNDFKIKKGNEIVIYTQGLLGAKYVEINGYNGPGEELKDGDIVMGVDPVSIDAMSIELSKLMKGVFGPTLTDEDVKQSFANLFNNAGAFTYNLNMLIKENRKNVFSTIGNLKSMASTLDKNLSSVLNEIKNLSKDFGEISKNNQKSINITVKNLEQSSKNLNQTVAELEESSRNLDHITKAIKNKEGTIGKLVYEKELHETAVRTLKNLEKFADIVKKNPRSLFFGK
ncbi:MAG: MCE family protein [Spirochaetes bacterium]|nr:MCE family protein [Spirochaetota bacterium]